MIKFTLKNNKTEAEYNKKIDAWDYKGKTRNLVAEKLQKCDNRVSGMRGFKRCLRFQENKFSD